MEFAVDGFMEIPGSNTSRLAADILAYLRQHDRSRDSLEGIAEWWLMENDIVRRMADVRNALQELVSAGLVEKVEAGSGQQYRIRHSTPEES